MQTEKYQAEVSPVDIYMPENGQTKNITIKIKMTADDHTLTSEEVNGYINSVIGSVISETKATVI